MEIKVNTLVNKKSLLTIFPLIGLGNEKVKVKRLILNDSVPETENLPIYMNEIATILWRKHLKCPVVPVSNAGRHMFLFPSNSSYEGGSIEVEYDSNTTFHLSPAEDELELEFSNATEQEANLLCKLLERAVSDRLIYLKNEYWKLGWTTFYRQVPENQGNFRDQVNAYRGFSFNVIHVDKRGFYLSVDATTKYVGKKPLSDYSDGERITSLSQHINVKGRRRGNFLRNNGLSKFKCKYSGSSDQTCEEFFLKELGKTVYEYYKERYPEIRISTSDRVVFAKDGTNTFPVPESTMFPIFTTEFDSVKYCSVKPQINPEDRLDEIIDFVGDLINLQFGNSKLSVGNKPLTMDVSTHKLPRLIFRDGNILDPYSHSNISHAEDARIFGSFNKKKIEYLYQFGPYTNEPVPPLTLLYPETTDRRLRDIFAKKIEKEIGAITGQIVTFKKFRPYSVLRDSYDSLLREASEVASQDKYGLVLCVLSDLFSPGAYSKFKQHMSQINYRSQCVREGTFYELANKADDESPNSTLQNLVFGLLRESNVTFWALEDGLNYDLSMGIDLLYGHIGNSLIFGRKGEINRILFEDNIVKGRMKEAITKNKMSKMISGALEDASSLENVRSLIIHRDGRIDISTLSFSY